MHKRTLTALGLILLPAPLAFADASFQSSMQVSGGQLIDTLKASPFTAHMVKNLLAPTNTITMIHGNQKARITKESTEIIDLDRGSIIHIDNEKKTYTETTFAQMRAAMAQMPEKMKEMQDQQAKAQAQMKQAQDQQPKTTLKTSVSVKMNDTGVTKMINGLMCEEHILTMTLTMTDPSAPPPPPPTPGQPPAPTAMGYTMTNDIWIAPDPPQVKEVQDFDIRMGQKMMEGVDMKAFVEQFKAQQQSYSNPQFAGILGGQPGAFDGMQEMGKQMAKLKGTHVMEIMSMGGTATGPAGSPAAAGPAAAPPASGGSVVGQVASDTATQTASGESGKLGVFGGALSNSVIGAFKRKKTETPPPAAPPANAPAAAGTTPGATQTTSVTMMSMTTQESNFSNEPIPASAFQIPAGFKKLPNPYDQMNAK